MNWIESYRLCNDMDRKVSTFIRNCDEVSYMHSEKNHTINKRETRIGWLLDQRKKEDELKYINDFLDDFDSKINFTEMPVAQYSFFDFGDRALTTKIQPMTMTMAVSSYHFESYGKLKSYLDSRLILNEEIYVFNYRVDKAHKAHHLRCFFINEALKNNKIEEYKYELGKTRRQTTNGL